MTIAVIGAGAIGSVVAAYLSKAGQDVFLVARPEQVKAINSDGLTITGVRGTENIRIRTASRLDKPYDLVIFTVKTQDLEGAFSCNSEHLETGFVLTTQNGVHADNLLSSHCDQLRQLTSIVMFGATYVNADEITFNFEGDWIVGRPFSALDPTAHKIGGILSSAFKIVMRPDIMGMKYLKLFVNFNNCIPALIGKTMQETFADMDLCRLSVLLLKEGIDIIQSAKIDIVSMPGFPQERILGLTQMPLDKAAEIIQKALTGLSKEPLYGSILQSILRARTSEIDFINGEVVQVSSSLKLSSPLNKEIVAMVHEVERTGKFFSVDDVKKKFNL